MVIKLIFLLIFLHKCISLPVENGKVKYDMDLNNGKISFEGDVNDPNYAYRVETSDGIIKHENRHFTNGSLVVSGGYEYIANNGVKYVPTADKNGFVPHVDLGAKPDNIHSTPTPPTYKPPTPSPSSLPSTTRPPVTIPADRPLRRYKRPVTDRPSIEEALLSLLYGSKGNGGGGEAEEKEKDKMIDPALLCSLGGSGCV